MSLRYRDSSGNETIVSGLTPGGDIEAGAVAQRTGLIEFTEATPTGVKIVDVTFDSPMPDADYEVQLSLYSNIPNEFGLCSIDYWNEPTHKTANGFTFLFYNGTGSTITSRMKFKYTATKTYTVQHAAETATAVNTIQAAMPAGASSANKLTTASQLSAVENALDTRLDSLEDVVPTGTTITNQLVNKSELQTAIDNVEIDVDDEIDSTSENPVENQVIAAALDKKEDKIFTGTQAEWNALSTQEKAQYKFVTLTDDENYVGNVTDAIANGEGAAVSSNAVYNYPINSINDDEHRPPTSGAVYDFIENKFGTKFKAVCNASILAAKSSRTLTLTAGTQLVVFIIGANTQVTGAFLINATSARAITVTELYKGNSLSYTTSTGTITFTNNLSGINPNINVLVFYGSFTVSNS